MTPRFLKDTKQQLRALIDTFEKLIGDQFGGLPEGQRYLTNEEYVKWFDMQIAGIPGPPEPVLDPMGQPMLDAMGQPMMQPGWEKEPRPNFVQACLQPGVKGGRAMVLKYAKLTGAEALMPTLTRMFVKGAQDGAYR